MLIDPRAVRAIVRQIDAHSAEISDITVAGHTLVTCGWSQLVSSTGLRVDRLLKVG
ncbi:unnamed protein product [Protopolystoma xenopodis]|uniref:Uncharacterized protein n=1 Tax=Protopolystoma xenopodis TaxID=117903 RepID=A0A448X3U6_9PLAT|nr:unnamed protein product [Protopolystoma xenopodis]